MHFREWARTATGATSGIVSHITTHTPYFSVNMHSQPSFKKHKRRDLIILSSNTQNTCYNFKILLPASRGKKSQQYQIHTCCVGKQDSMNTSQIPFPINFLIWKFRTYWSDYSIMLVFINICRFWSYPRICAWTVNLQMLKARKELQVHKNGSSAGCHFSPELPKLL